MEVEASNSSEDEQGHEKDSIVNSKSGEFNSDRSTSGLNIIVKNTGIGENVSSEDVL